MGLAAALEIAQDIREKIKHQNSVRMIFAAAPSQSDMLKARRLIGAV
jgi:glucosamine-6-phosphate deaminase